MKEDAALPAGALRTRACAKVNLTLQVLGRRADGYHELESLVAFADCADTLTLFPGSVTLLDVAVLDGVPEPGIAGPDNLVLKAARIAASDLGIARAGRFLLDKRLPVAAGIGGGSADAAAALRLILAACGAEIDDAALGEAALKIGADVPVCLHSRASRVTGIGGSVELLEDFPELDAVLVNPRVAVPTAQVFAALNIDPGTTLARPSLAAIVREAGPREVLAAIRDGGNDLQAAAGALCPQIGACLGALDGAGAALSRMSGSGATCFGLYDDEQAAARAAAAIAAEHPGWWVRPVRLS